MQRNKTKPNFPKNLEHAFSEFFPEGFVLFGIDPESGELIMIPHFPNGAATLAINSFIRYYAEFSEEAQKQAFKEFLGFPSEEDE